MMLSKCFKYPGIVLSNWYVCCHQLWLYAWEDIGPRPPYCYSYVVEDTSAPLLTIYVLGTCLLSTSYINFSSRP